MFASEQTKWPFLLMIAATQIMAITLMAITSKTPRSSPLQSASISQVGKSTLGLFGHWSAQSTSGIEKQIANIKFDGGLINNIDCKEIKALDTVGALLIIKLLQFGKQAGVKLALSGLSAHHQKQIDGLTQHQQLIVEFRNQKSPQKNKDDFFTSIGISTVTAFDSLNDILTFIGETAHVFAKSILQPKRFRLRPILFNIRTAGFDALPIVGLLSFLLGVVVAYQGADQLRQYGANIFVVDLVGLSMLREFAPLITAIIIAGRSGSAYAAQIGTMAVTEEIDALSTLGISPQELLVLPKVIALIIVMPLLTMFADLTGVLGGMIMASNQLGVGYGEFIDQFAKTVSPTALMIGIGKAPVFAAIIAMVGCYQGFKTKGGADSVGRQTTRSVVQSIFLVIVANAIFSVVFSALDL